MKRNHLSSVSTFLSACAVLLSVVAAGCGGNYVRGDEVAGLDDYAMSTGLDKRDLEKLFDENMKSLMESAMVSRWKNQSEPPVVSIFPIANETSEHIREPLDALAAKLETQLINGGIATVVDHAQQERLIAEVQRQQGAAFSEADSAEVGRQLGAAYFLTGKIYTSSEKVDDEKRVQYFLFMKIVEIETAVIRWQNEANLTKGLIK
jgi:uncharacterized protein (TIGR02722 family)